MWGGRVQSGEPRWRDWPSVDTRMLLPLQRREDRETLRRDVVCFPSDVCIKASQRVCEDSRFEGLVEASPQPSLFGFVFNQVSMGYNRIL